MVTIQRQARLYVTHAIERHGMPKASTLLCVDCNKQARDYDHYKGYARENWLIVKPVCRSCHFKRENLRDPNRVINQAKGRHKICPHGITPTNSCVECQREACRKWRSRNTEYDRQRCLDNYYKRRARETEGDATASLRQ